MGIRRMGLIGWGKSPKSQGRKFKCGYGLIYKPVSRKTQQRLDDWATPKRDFEQEEVMRVEDMREKERKERGPPDYAYIAALAESKRPSSAKRSGSSPPYLFEE